MIKLIIEKIQRITKNKRKLEEALEVKIENRGKEVYIEGTPESEYTAEKVIDALNFGFPFSQALLIKKEDLIFEKIPIKEHTNQKNLERVRARIIGSKGKTLKTVSQLSDCFLELKDNSVGIIGDPEHIQVANEAIVSLIKGTKQGNVYAYLEKHQPKIEHDLGLRDKK